MSRILPLSAETISQIYSSKQITSLEDVVTGLVENSLDAGSNEIEITADFRRGSCTVEDNGSGIPPREFLQNGGLGKMYHTSKRATSIKDDLHGDTGTYLASLAALSMLSITTYHPKCDQQSTLTVHRGKVLTRHVAALPGQQLASCSSQGTLVAVHDLFGNIPVRVKQRALAASESNDNGKEWLGLKRSIVALLLAWPKPCAIRIRDADSGNRLLHLSGLHPSVNNSLTEKSLAQLRGRAAKFDVQDVLPILSQSALAPMQSRSQWIPVSASTPELAIKGAICRIPAPTKQCQFISVGVHPCDVASGSNDMYDVVNRLFVNSSFGALDQDLEINELKKHRRKRDRRFKSDGYTQKQLHGRKGVDRWPMFVLRIAHLHRSDKALHPERMDESSLKGILDVLEAVISQWLTTNHFRPRKINRRKKEVLDSPNEPGQAAASDKRAITTPKLSHNDLFQSATTSKKRKYVDITGSTRVFEQNDQPRLNSPNDFFSSWSRIKSGNNSFYDEVWQGRKTATAPARQNETQTTGTDQLSRPVLRLQDLAAGELSRVKPRIDGEFIHRSESGVLRPSPTPAAITENVSSEDFGSFDDLEVLAAAKAVEQVDILDIEPKLVSAEEVTVSIPELETDDDAVIDWTDPLTQKSFRVNSRTGVVLPSRPKSATSHVSRQVGAETTNRQVAAIDTSKTSCRNPLSLSRRTGPSNPVASNWLPGFLKEWNNPVFVQQTEERIPVTSFSLDDVYAAEYGNDKCTHGFQIDASPKLGRTIPSNLSKSILKVAKVIKQVDQKYILCKASTTGGGGDDDTLILIDQHAASERVILENLLADLCSLASTAAGQPEAKVKSVRLDKALHFQISENEYRMFQDHVRHFAEWGIIYQLFDKDEILGASQVRAPKRELTIVVKELPPAIAERCSLIPRLLIELLRAEIWQLEGSSKKPLCHRYPDPSLESLDEDHAWLKHLGSCPKGLLDMLNSRACRSAIMFNDVLSVMQCQRLLSDLSRCAFPFMCAHGRVSMVPLVKIGEDLESAIGSALSNASDGASEGFSGAFRRWHKR